MSMIMGILFFIITLFFATTGALSNISWLALFWNAPSFLIVVVPAAVFSISITSLHTNVICIRALFTQNYRLGKSELDQVSISLRLFGDTSFLMGILGTIISLVIIGQEAAQITAFGPNLSVAILTICYGLIIKIGSYIAEKRLIYQSLPKKSEHSG